MAPLLYRGCRFPQCQCTKGPLMLVAIVPRNGPSLLLRQQLIKLSNDPEALRQVV